ncbi:hypothetical protein Tsubulata_003278 [Turnera subulata]|uniref:SHSP domain-containing protein n=1 Tax=Turnera subulata TaxID=218843 RepID=A0A9Q0J440_9ROSI|nr:hypothetical protein Tsubulata_003278 [Turnera subulata]
MSIVPVNNQSGTVANPESPDTWDPLDYLSSSLDLWDPFQDFTFPSILSSRHFPSFPRDIFPSLETQVNWSETSRAHVFRAVFPGFDSDDVLVYIDDDNALQISTESGKFMSRFKLPENARRDQVKASMVNGVLTVTVPKDGGGTQRPNVRVIDISGSG